MSTWKFISIIVGAILLLLLLLYLFLKFVLGIDLFIGTTPSRTQTPDEVKVQTPFITIKGPKEVDFDPTRVDTGLKDPRIFEIEDGEDRDQTYTKQEELPKLVRIFEGPTAGYRADSNENGYGTVKVVEGGQSNQYEIEIFPFSIKKVGVGGILKTKRAYILQNGSSIIQFEDDKNEGVLGSILTEFGNNSNNTILSDNLNVTTSQNSFFLIERTKNGSIGTVIDTTTDSSGRQILELGIKNINPRWERNEKITLVTSPSDYIDGNAYLLDPVTEGLMKIGETSKGLSVLYDEESGIYIERSRRDIDRRGTILKNILGEEIGKIPTTLTEKCDALSGIFICGVPISFQRTSLGGNIFSFIDSWYIGDTKFSDIIIEHDTVTNSKSVLLNPRDEEIRKLSNNTIFDVIDPKISDDGRFLFFVNKYDLSLWMLRLY